MLTTLKGGAACQMVMQSPLQQRQNLKSVNTTLLKDFLSLIKIGIVNSNLITTFTGIWLLFNLLTVIFLKS